MTVLLFSGGLDSYIAAWLLKPDILLYINIGLKEQERELEQIKKQKLPHGSKLILDDRLKLADQKLANEIVPMRNLFFAMIGAYYGDEVILGSLAGDTTKDKDEIFCEKTQDLLRHIFSIPEKNSEHLQKVPFKFKTPFRKYTKADMVKMFLNQEPFEDYLYTSRSCYDSTDKECGKCRSCIRKYVSFEINGLDTSSVFENDPVSLLPEAYEYALMKNRGKEIDEIKQVMEMKRR